MAVYFQLIVLLSFTIFVVHSDILDHRFFLGQILEEYGINGTISYEGFERLYNNLGLGGSNQSQPVTENVYSVSTSHIRTNRQVKAYNSSNKYPPEEELTRLIDQHDEVISSPGSTPPRPPPGPCLSARELLVVYGVSGSLSPVSFLHLCPAIVYELDQRTCLHQTKNGHHQRISDDYSDTNSNWLFGIISIFVISLSGVFCVLTVQFLQKSLVKQLISFLVALAVGTLLGDALLHLIPHALENHGTNAGKSSHNDAALKTGVIFLTIVFFFTFEAVLNIIRSRKEELELTDEKNNYVTVHLDKSEREMVDVNVVHGHGHSHSGTGSNTAVMVVMADGLHNLTDGLAIGAAFSGGLAPGFATAVAVFTHELPHELGDFAVLLQSGVPVRRAVMFNLLSSVLSLIGCVVGLVIGNFGDTTRWVYAVTAGCFIYIALSNLVPEINKERCNWSSAVLRLSGILSGGLLMGCIVILEDDIEHLFS